jgi:hypothetical protein
MTLSTPLPTRAGPRPRTTSSNPHTQLDQQPADPSVREHLAARLFALPGVVERPSVISVPGARALTLREPDPQSPMFMVGSEFAHLHPAPDFSLHAALPRELVGEAIEAGWAEPHPIARLGLIPDTIVMLYAQRDENELDVVAGLVTATQALLVP